MPQVWPYKAKKKKKFYFPQINTRKIYSVGGKLIKQNFLCLRLKCNVFFSCPFTLFAVFQGKIVAQGKLLLQDTFLVTDQDAGLLPRCKERRVFLFEQIVIFSEPLDKKKGFSMPGFLFKNSIKVACVCVFSHVLTQGPVTLINSFH